MEDFESSLPEVGIDTCIPSFHLISSWVPNFVMESWNFGATVQLSPEKMGPLGLTPAQPRSSTLSRTCSRLRAVTPPFPNPNEGIHNTSTESKHSFLIGKNIEKLQNLTCEIKLWMSRQYRRSSSSPVVHLLSFHTLPPRHKIKLKLRIPNNDEDRDKKKDSWVQKIRIRRYRKASIRTHKIALPMTTGSAVDPDWIRIQEGKNDPQTKKKVNKFNVLKFWMFSFEGCRLSCSLDINKFRILIKKIFKQILCSIFFLQSLVIKTLDPDPYPDWSGSVSESTWNARSGSDNRYR